MNYNQLGYIEKVIKNATTYKKINLRPLDAEIWLLKKIKRESNEPTI